MDDRVLAELDALDAALRDEAVAPEHADLATLVADVRETAPQATPAFLAELDARVREGFPPRDGAPVPERAPRQRRRLLFGAGAIAGAAAIAVAVTIGLGTEDTTNTFFDSAVPLAGETSSSEPEAARSAAGAEAPDSAAQLDSAPVQPPDAELPSTGAIPDRANRAVQRSATLDLTVPTDEVQKTADAVVRATDRVGGMVQTSSISVGENSSGQAQFTLRVPSDKLDEALTAYSKLGSVANRTQDAEDITRQTTSAKDLLSDARAERRGLLRALGQADTRREVESLRARLRIVRADIARRQAALRELQNRAGYATVALTVSGHDADDGASSGDDDGWSFGDALGDAGRLLEVVAGVAIISLAALIPLLALAFAAALGGRALVRRRRERALDAT
ncbi:MAG: DUF4349 domain-containing protein [Solirubrobacteraceae bacterium]|nr:DUF4349 domain-containing protein [Solirubrobacteraceae bacterium]